MEPRQPATYKDLKRVTGLSLATISKYYNGGNVLPANGAAIERAAEELGFRVNSFASGLRRGTSRTVGVLLPSLLNGFHLSIVVAVEKHLRSEGIGVVVTSHEAGPESGADDAVELLLSRRVDGIITVPAHSDTRALSDAMAAGIPVVTIDWWLPGLEADSVSLDNVGAGRLAGGYLVNHGHTRLATIIGKDTVSTMHDRLKGFLAASEAGGVAPDSDHVVQTDLTVDAGHEGMARLLASSSRPTAVFAANYELTLGALIAINESGLRLGGDVSLIGFDAIDLARATRPQLTIVAQPVLEIAAEAARIMLERLRETAAPEKPMLVRLPGQLVLGASVTPRHD